jgi:hypothetical protein
MPESTSVKASTSIIPDLSGNMQFVGMFNIVYGAISCITIIGALVGIPLIFSGLRLREAAALFEEYRRTGDTEAIMSGFERMNRAFFIAKILIIVSVALFVVYIAVFMIVGVSYLGGFTDF